MNRSEKEIRVILAEGKIAEAKYALQDVLLRHNLTWNEYRKLESEFAEKLKPIGFESAQLADDFMHGRFQKYQIDSDDNGTLTGKPREAPLEVEQKILGNRQPIIDVSSSQEPPVPVPAKKEKEPKIMQEQTAAAAEEFLLENFPAANNRQIMDPALVRRVAEHILLRPNEAVRDTMRKFGISRYVYDRVRNAEYSSLSPTLKEKLVNIKVAASRPGPKRKFVTKPKVRKDENPAQQEAFTTAVQTPAVPATRAVSMNSDRAALVGWADRHAGKDEPLKVLLQKVHQNMLSAKISQIVLGDDGSVHLKQERTFSLSD